MEWDKAGEPVTRTGEEPIMNSRTISVPINRPPAEVREFASTPDNLPQWVRSFYTSVNKLGLGGFALSPGAYRPIILLTE